MLNRTTLLAAAALALGGIAAVPAPAAFAHGANIRAMWHTTHLVGTPVFNDQHQQIGTISDVLVSPSGGATEAVLSVGAYVGGNKQVAVPLAHLAMARGAMTMPGATKATLEALPTYIGGGNG
jgi:PRC-barrel domain